MRNILLNRPDLTLAQLTRTKNLMNTNVRDCLVTDYESLIPSLELPDPGALHVLAAAIRSGSSFIVTFNLKDFPMVALAPYGVEAIHPDEFILQLIDLDAVEVLKTAHRQLSTLKNPPLTGDKYLDTLDKARTTAVSAVTARDV